MPGMTHVWDGSDGVHAWAGLKYGTDQYGFHAWVGLSRVGRVSTASMPWKDSHVGRPIRRPCLGRTHMLDWPIRRQCLCFTHVSAKVCAKTAQYTVLNSGLATAKILGKTVVLTTVACEMRVLQIISYTAHLINTAHSGLRKAKLCKYS